MSRALLLHDGRLRGVEAKIQDRDVRIFRGVEVAASAVFLHAQTHMFRAHVEVGFDHPPVAIDAAFAEDEGVRPQAAMAVGGQRALRLADQLVEPLLAAAQADSGRRGVAFDEGSVVDGMRVHGRHGAGYSGS